VNAWDETEEELEAFAKTNGLSYPILIEGSEVTAKYGSGSSVPVVMWINRDGVIVDTEWGFGGPDTLREKTRKLLASN